ncbi:MAG: IclR family transcriptional regulator, partial [Desulfitobacteriaceae bacterium]|nr:IclR family transcriptional regulator [Desulfitobacteriaceae bacterium]
MGLRDKTQRKFVEFFENMARMYEGAEFEVAYSQIQRDTGSANSTLKRALRTMVEEGVLKIELGRNSRYGRF